MKAQGKSLVKIVSLSLFLKDEPEKFDDILKNLAKVHNEKKGVKAVEYGIMGEVLIWTLGQVIGPENFTPAHTKAWVRVFCRMIRIMVPLAVQYEIEDGESLRARFSEEGAKEIEPSKTASAVDPHQASSRVDWVSADSAKPKT